MSAKKSALSLNTVSVIKLLLVKKFKLSLQNGEACIGQRNIYKLAKTWVCSMELQGNTVHAEETPGISDNEKIPDGMVNKKLLETLF